MQMGNAKHAHAAYKSLVSGGSTYTSANAAWTAADRTLTATRGLSAHTAVSKGTSVSFSYGNTRNSGASLAKSRLGRYRYSSE
jgi:hypothetical protein